MERKNFGPMMRFLLQFLRAFRPVEGWQDERGFHFGREPFILALLLGLALPSQANMILLRPTTPAAPVGLVEHMVSQLASRTNGATADFLGPKDGSNFFSVPPTNRPNFFLLGVTNINAQSAAVLYMGGLGCGGYLTAISPHICVGAAHANSGMGADGKGITNVWLLPSGGYYTNSVVTNAYPGGDILLVLMRQTNAVWAKVFPDASAKIPFWRNGNIAASAPPIFVRFHQGIGVTNQFTTAFVSGSGALGSFGHYTGQFEFGDYSRGDAWVPGDSGGAAFAIVNNEASFVCAALYSGGGPAIAGNLATVNAAMSNLCVHAGLPVEQVTLTDLSSFPNL